jgi:hypothetical protein
MTRTEQTEITNLSVHYVGNKHNEEGIKLSESELQPAEKETDMLKAWFLDSFDQNGYYNFFHETELQLNEVFSFVGSIFENPGNLHQYSIYIAKHLYSKSIHPKILGGELYVAHFKNCLFDGKTVDAIGIYKSENRDSFLKVEGTNNGFSITGEEGINIHNLQKGCLIFNILSENGYVVSIVDRSGKGAETQYWIDNFLKIRQHNDSYLKTSNILNFCKSYIVNALPEQFDVTKADQVDLLNRSAHFFKQNETFDLEEFSDEVMQQPELIDSFKKYKTEFEVEEGMQLSDSFEISGAAVKKQSRVFKSVIKLDKNFHIYIHGDKSQIVKGFDEASGRHFYQLFFQEES